MKHIMLISAFCACFSAFAASSELTFSADFADIEAPNGYEFLEDLFPTEVTIHVKNGTKWSCDKAVKIAYKKFSEDGEKYYELQIPETGSCNYAGLKLTYTAKKGTFKGSYTIYATNADSIASNKKPTLKKYTVKVVGTMARGSSEGEGTATVKIGKRTYTWPVYITCEYCAE